VGLYVAVYLNLNMNGIPSVFVSVLSWVLTGRVWWKGVRSCHYPVQLYFHALVYKPWFKCRPGSMLLCVVINTNVTLEINNEHVKWNLCSAQANL
jgi:hypothetical protein